MHLTDGRRCKRLLLKVLQLVSPVRAEVAADGFLRREERKCLACDVSLQSLCCLLQLSLYKYCTIICLEGMKSALWRTRSKILANWGLMKASSERRQEEWEWSTGMKTLRKISLCLIVIKSQSEVSSCFSEKCTSLGANLLILWMELQKIWWTFRYINDHQRKDKLLKLIVWTIKKKKLWKCLI